MKRNEDLQQAITEIAKLAKDPAGNEILTLSVEKTAIIGQALGFSRVEIELAALEQGIIPERYQRSIGTIGLAGQIKLLNAKVGVIGAGGLGGLVIELLARMGIGKLVVVDGDIFTDNNLNRQLLATESEIGCSKVEAAGKRVSALNGATVIETHNLIGDADNLLLIFKDCDLVIDCLDNLPSRFDLEQVCSQLGIVMVHGAIAGFLGQLAVIRPGKPLLEAIYGPVKGSGTTRGVELQLGNPAATPAMLASWQVCEAVKYLSDVGGVLADDKLLIIDMQAADFYKVDVVS